MAEGGPSSPQEGVDSNPGIKLNVNGTQLKKLLECPVCYDTILPPITLCSNGHSVCTYCKDRLDEKKCPTCRSNLTNVRDIFAELFLENCSLVCKFQEFGCVAELPGRALAEHQRVCEFSLRLLQSSITPSPTFLFTTHISQESQIPAAPPPKFTTSPVKIRG